MKIAFIGLGIMGSRMAANLQKSGHAVTVYNRTAAKGDPLRAQGARVADSPANAADGVEILFTMLSDPDAVAAVALGPQGFLDRLGRGTTWIDCSTVNPSFSKRMAAEAARRGIRFIDAPVSGSSPVAADGKLTFWVGGDAADVDKVRPALSCMGKRIEHLGPAGCGTVMKLVVNLLLGTGLAAFAEALLLGESLGLPQAKLFDLLNGLPMVAPYLLTKRPQIESGNYEAQFPLAWMQKDLHLATLSGYECGAALPVTNTAKEVYRLAMRSGRAHADVSAIYDYLAD